VEIPVPKTKTRRIAFVLAVLSLALPLRAAELTRARYTMGTLLRVSLVGDAPETLDPAAEAVFAEVDRWDRLLSTYKPESEVSRINAAAPEPVLVSSDTLRAVAGALNWAEKTGGAFDPTVGPLVRLWGFDGPSPRRPSPDEIESAKVLVGYEQVEVSTTASTVRLPRQGMTLDFGGHGKGWALDRALEKVRDRPGLEEVVLDFGGQLLFWSRAPKMWTATVRHPKKKKTLAAFQVPGNGSLATSSFSERFLMAADPKSPRRQKRYGHILDPRTGSPAMGVESVTVWAAAAEEADVLTKPLFILGRAEGLRFADAHGIAARLFTEGKRGLAAVASQKWREIFESGFRDQRGP
jgi:FAD:protein FMN transferase